MCVMSEREERERRDRGQRTEKIRVLDCHTTLCTMQGRRGSSTQSYRRRWRSACTVGARPTAWIAQWVSTTVCSSHRKSSTKRSSIFAPQYVHCIVALLQCTAHSAHPVHSSQYTVYNAQYTVHSKQYTGHSTVQSAQYLQRVRMA